MRPDQAYTYRFDIPVPARTENNRRHQYKHDEAQNWHVVPHTLPPSFIHNSRHGTDTEPDYAKIEYGVIARLSCPGVYVALGKQQLDLTVTAPIQFQPNNPHLQELLTSPPSLARLPKPFTLQSSILNGQSPDRSFSQSLRDRFSPSTPSLTFDLCTSLPTLLLTGSEFRFCTSFTVLQSPKTQRTSRPSPSKSQKSV
ncbi:hypothetical protein NX059_001264 [Plenodomus lindquistii]|nr:hypothetical protein NX059_001264 [Plenodomus lindquistii]